MDVDGLDGTWFDFVHGFGQGIGRNSQSLRNVVPSWCYSLGNWDFLCLPSPGTGIRERPPSSGSMDRSWDCGGCNELRVAECDRAWAWGALGTAGSPGAVGLRSWTSTAVVCIAWRIHFGCCGSNPRAQHCLAVSTFDKNFRLRMAACPSHLGLDGACLREPCHFDVLRIGTAGNLDIDERPFVTDGCRSNRSLFGRKALGLEIRRSVLSLGFGTVGSGCRSSAEHVGLVASCMLVGDLTS